MNTFKKEERLCSKTLLSLLYSKGSSFLLYPFRVTCLQIEAVRPSPVQVVINVPKKRFKHAVDRNLIKRRIREVYRLNKEAHFYQQLSLNGQLLLLSLQYVGKEAYHVPLLDKKIVLVFNKLLVGLKEKANVDLK